MIALPKNKMNVDDFLLWCEDQTDGRYELEDGRVIAMSPENIRHVEVKSAAWLALKNAIEKTGVHCKAYSDGVGIKIDDTKLREPDAAVQCADTDPDSMTLDEPIIVLEVLSPSSIRRDTVRKVAEYFQVDSICHYLILDPKSAMVVCHSRSDRNSPIMTTIQNEGEIELSPPGIVVAVSDLFGEVDR